MSKFIHEITVYHFNSDETVSKIYFKKEDGNAVYFRHNKKSNLINKRA